MPKLSSLLKRLKTEIGTGLLVIVAIVILVLVSIRISTSKICWSEDTYELFSLLDDSSGLIPGTAVRAAGIRIGVIKSITLENKQARVTLEILDSIQVYTDAAISVKSLGILGDRYIEVDQGSITNQLLTDGDQIINIRSAASIEQIITSTNAILSDVQKVVSSFSNSLGGPDNEMRLNLIIQNIADISSSLNSTVSLVNSRMDSIITNIDRTAQSTALLTKDLSDTLKENREALNLITANVATLTASLSKEIPPLAANLNEITASNKENINGTLENLQKSTAALTATLNNLEKTTARIENGQGTVGQLINNEDTAKSVNETIAGLNSFLTDANRIKFDIGFRGERLLKSKSTKGYVSLYYIPKRDHFFIAQIISNPSSRIITSEEVITTTSGGTTTSERIVKDKTDTSYLFSLMIAQRYYDSLLRFGFIESKVGFGFDQFFGKAGNFTLSFDAWNFDRADEGAHLKASALWRFLGNTYFVAGYDDLNNRDKSKRQGFIGLGIDFNEDSLKLLVSSLPGLVSN